MTTWPLPAGENASTCYGSVLQGQFEGTIRTTDGVYHVESVQRYTSSPTDHHSIIYREEDMSKATSVSILSAGGGKNKMCYLFSHRACVFGLCGSTHQTPCSDLLHSLANLKKNGRSAKKKKRCCNCTLATRTRGLSQRQTDQSLIRTNPPGSRSAARSDCSPI